MIEFFNAHSGVVMGLLIALAGVIVWFFPQLIKGYYNIPPEEQDETDWQGLRRYLLIGFVALGTALAGLDLAIRNESISYALRMIVAFIGVIALIATAQRFVRKKR